MTVGPPQAPMLVKEHITWDEQQRCVTYTSNDPEKTGSVTNIVEEIQGVVTVTFHFHWVWTAEADREKVAKMIQQFVAWNDKAVVDTVNAAEKDFS